MIELKSESETEVRFICFFLLSKKATKNKAARWLGNKSVQKLSDMF